LRSGEIDIIAQEGDTICFVEVKMRRSTVFGSPFEAVAKPKMQKLIPVAQHYLKAKRLNNRKARFDVVAVIPGLGADFKVELLKNAFSLDEATGY
jgi:putative endonuclease